MYCRACGHEMDENARFCPACGADSAQQSAGTQQNSSQGSNYYYGPQNAAPGGNAYYGQQYAVPTAIDPSWPVKSKVAAGLLAILLGGLGIHKFYLGKVGLGVVYLLFCWTGVPEIIGLVEGIIYLTDSDESFQLKNHVRIDVPS